MNSHARHRTWGFTLIELVTVILILGILAVAAAPRFFNRAGYDNRGFYDQVLATLRYAQKIAIAQRTTACVTFTANSVAITGVGPACATALSPAVSVSSSNASFSPTPTAFNFNALGKPTPAQTITISGVASSISVTAETGYVY